MRIDIILLSLIEAFDHGSKELEEKYGSKEFDMKMSKSKGSFCWKVTYGLVIAHLNGSVNPSIFPVYIHIMYSAISLMRLDEDIT